jgi:hypothetical protein
MTLYLLHYSVPNKLSLIRGSQRKAKILQRQKRNPVARKPAKPSTLLTLGEIYLGLPNYHPPFICASKLPSVRLRYIKLPSVVKKAPPSALDVKMDGKGKPRAPFNQTKN